MSRIELKHIFSVELSVAFNYITDIANWPEYWPGFVRLEDRANARWSEPGDEVTVVLKLLGQERPMHMMLEHFKANSLVAYRTRQKGLPDARHERHFNSVPDGVEYTLVVDFEPRPGLRGLYDRLLVTRGVRRAMRKTVDNIDRLLK